MSEKRESKYVRFARLAYAIAQASLPRYAHTKSPQRFTLPQLAVCVLLTHYLDLSYRDTEEWLLASAEVRAVLELDDVPDHTTIMRMAKRLTLARIEAMQTELLSQLEGKEDGVAIDATGFRFTQASAYYTTRSGRRLFGESSARARGACSGANPCSRRLCTTCTGRCASYLRN